MSNPTPKIIALVLARGGSKGIPKKNIIDVVGRPLIAWSIEAGKKSKHIERVIVSSDSEEILDVAKMFGAETLMRPAELATDSARSELAMIHALQFIGADKEDLSNHYTMLLQPTSPLRTTKHIDEAIEHMLARGGDALVSVCEIDRKYLKAYVEGPEGQLVAAATNPEYPNTARQFLPKLFMPNGAIYIVATRSLFETGKLTGKKTIPYVMDAEVSIDVDSMEDLERVERRLRAEE